MNTKNIPSDGWKGLVENWKSDLPSGFIVALLALPLSLGIASASDFPNPLYGVLTAIIGGIVVGLFMGARLTIKGPAAGLIVIVASAIAAFGGGEAGWRLALAAIIVAAVLQVLFGLLKLGKLSDFFPLSAVHGMLAAIGIIIMSKQLHVLMGVNPKFPEGAMHHGELVAGKPMVAPLDLFSAIPSTFGKLMADPVYQSSLWVGLICLVIVFAWPMLKSPILKKIPAPMVVLFVAVPLGSIMGLTQLNGQLVKVGNFLNFSSGNGADYKTFVLGFQPDFSHISQFIGPFVQYVALFAIIGSLESLLTAKAIDLLDPFKRKTDFNKDLIAVGTGNALAGALGGLPMISEVARSSSNVNNGGKTRWANFFHGFMLLIFVALLSGVIEMIPKSALAALLIGVGFKLAHPREFIHMFKIGKEQLLVFLVTIVFTLAEDLLIGIAAGIVAEMIVLLVSGASLSSLFKAQAEVAFIDDKYEVHVSRAAVFTNFIGIKNKLESIPGASHITIYFDNSRVIDHSAMEQLHLFKSNYEREGGEVIIEGLNDHKTFSKHHLAGRKKKK
ncbi:MAG: SulP family inorganic anion transporter [Sediminibacterium sp.]